MASTLTRERLWSLDGLSFDSRIPTGTEPLAFKGGDTNLYRYVHNEPTNAIDPTGYAAKSPPSGSELIHNPKVQQGMRDLRRRSCEGTSKRHEERAWIWWNKNTGVITVEPVNTTQQVRNAKTRDRCYFGPVPNRGPNVKLIGIIHTHPDPDVGGFDPRPSDMDKANQPGYKVPWIITTTKYGDYLLENGDVSEYD